MTLYWEDTCIYDYNYNIMLPYMAVGSSVAGKGFGLTTFLNYFHFCHRLITS